METNRKIDIHAHVTIYPDILPPNPAKGYPFVSPQQLIDFYDRLGVEMGVLLPLISPEGQIATMSNENCCIAAREYPDRFAWFCNLEPRGMSNNTSSNFSYLLEHYKKLGAKGVGEITSNVYFDDPKLDNMFSHCEEQQMPVLFHISPAIGEGYGVVDDLGLPRLEKMLKKHPNLIFIGHSPCFWTEISSDNTEETRNNWAPATKVTEGRLPKLLREYGNLCCDLSAGSGSTAMMRDPEYAVSFLTEFQDRIFYGHDICSPTNNPFTFQEFFDGLYTSGAISETVYKKVARENALKLLGLTK